MTPLSRSLLSLAALLVVPAFADDAADRPALWGQPSVDGGRCCATLGEVRSHIDRLDGEIVHALAERAKYVAEAGRFKKDPAAVSDPARVEAIVAHMREVARADGLAPEVADKTFRAMIAAFEEVERAEWRRAHLSAPPRGN